MLFCSRLRKFHSFSYYLLRQISAKQFESELERKSIETLVAGKENQSPIYWSLYVEKKFDVFQKEDVSYLVAYYFPL